MQNSPHPTGSVRGGHAQATSNHLRSGQRSWISLVGALYAGLLISALPFTGLQIFTIPLPIFISIGTAPIFFYLLVTLKLRPPFFLWFALPLALLHFTLSINAIAFPAIAFLKVSAYIFYATAVFSSLSLIERQSHMEIVDRSASVGLVLFIVVFLYFAYDLGVIGSLIRLDYFRAVVPTLVAVGNLGETQDFESSDALRNTVAEAVAFLVFFSLRSRSWGQGILGSLLVFTFQSRRAFAELAVVLLSKLRLKYSLVLAIVAAPLAVFLISIVDLTNSRYAELDTGMRGDQLAQAMVMIGERPLWGWGFGTKVFDAYVHNFFISSFLMSGILAFGLAILLAGHAIYRATFAKRYGVLIVFCLGNMLLAATVEGLLSLTAWAALAFIYWETSENALWR